MSGPIEIVVIIAAIGYIMARRMIGEPAEAKRMLLLPVVLGAVGISDLVKVPQTPVSIGFLIGTTVVSLVIGLLRGASVRVFQRDGVVFMRYTWVTILLWVLNLGIRFGASTVLGAVDPAAAHAASNGLLLGLGASVLAEGVAVLAKAMRSDARIMWSKGKNGNPHTYLDTIAQQVQTTDWSRTQSGRRFDGFRDTDFRDSDFRQQDPRGGRR